MSLMVPVDVKQHWTMHTHWLQFVSNISTDIRGHGAPHHKIYANICRCEVPLCGNLSVLQRQKLPTNSQWIRKWPFDVRIQSLTCYTSNRSFNKYAQQSSCQQCCFRVWWVWNGISGERALCCGSCAQSAASVATMLLAATAPNPNIPTAAASTTTDYRTRALSSLPFLFFYFSFMNRYIVTPISHHTPFSFFLSFFFSLFFFLSF